jgi:hypothetical protein
MQTLQFSSTRLLVKTTLVRKKSKSGAINCNYQMQHWYKAYTADLEDKTLFPRRFVGSTLSCEMKFAVDDN